MSSVTEYKYVLLGEYSKVNWVNLPDDYYENPDKYSVKIHYTPEAIVKVALARMSIAGDEFSQAFGLGVQELANLGKEERAQEKEAYENFIKASQKDKSMATQTADKILSSINLNSLSLTSEDVQLIKQNSGDKLIDTSSDLLTLSFNLDKIFDIISALDKEGIDVEKQEEQFHIIKSSIGEAIRASDFKSLHSFVAKTDELYQTLKEILHINNQIIKHIDKVNQIIYEFENEVNAPYTLIFKNELNDQIQKALLQKEENKKAIARNKMIQEQMEIVTLSQKCQQLMYLSDQGDAKDIIASVKSILSDEKLTYNDKYKMLNIRKGVLNDILIKAEQKKPRLAETKKLYDVEYAIALQFASMLEEPAPKYEFNPDRAEESLNNLKQFNATRIKKANAAAQAEKIEKAIREAMSDMKFEYIGSSKKNINGNSLSKDIYHLENGNVVTFTVSDKGKITTRVTGVKVNGVAENKSSQVSSMKHFCSKTKELERRLKEKGVNLEQGELLVPDMKYTSEIELPKEVSTNKMNVIRNAKTKPTNQQVLKYKEIK